MIRASLLPVPAIFRNALLLAEA